MAHAALARAASNLAFSLRLTIDGASYAYSISGNEATADLSSLIATTDTPSGGVFDGAGSR